MASLRREDVEGILLRMATALEANAVVRR